MFSLPIIGGSGLSGSEITKIRVSRPGAALHIFHYPYFQCRKIPSAGSGRGYPVFFL